MSDRDRRILSLDVIRGVAVMGIFSVNVIAFAMIEEAYFNPGAYGGHRGLDLVVWALNMLFVDGKMRTLFSMLFGASMMLVVEREEAAGRSGPAVHYRRMAVLLAFGLAHYFFLWFGDILALYAVTGMLAFFWRDSSPQRLVRSGSIAVVISMVMFASFVLQQYAADAAAHAPGASSEAIKSWNDGLGAFYPSPDRLAQDIALHRGSWWGLVRAMFADWHELVFATFIFLPETLGLMMFGLAGYKSGFLTGEWDDERYRRFAIRTVPLGLVAFALVVWADIASRFSPVVLFAAFVVLVTPFRIAMAAGYAAVIILLTRRNGPLAQRIGAAGRAAFTNYLGTSLVAAFIFYGWGLGLYASLSRWQAWLVVPLVWAIMLAWSKPWLDRFRYGPFEWLWRSLARGRPQPMRKG